MMHMLKLTKLKEKLTNLNNAAEKVQEEIQEETNTPAEEQQEPSEQKGS